jgi:hypothetical protein
MGLNRRHHHVKFTIGNLKPQRGGLVLSSNVAVFSGAVTLTRTPTPGSVLVAIGIQYPAAVTVQAGWTEITDARHDAAVLDPATRACWQLVGASPSAVATPFNTSGGRQGTAVFEVSGLSPTWTATYERTDVTSPSGGGGTVSVSRTTASSRTMLLAAGFAQTNSADPGAGSISGTPSAWTSIGGQSRPEMGAAAAYQLIEAASTAVTATYFGGGNSAIVVISVLPTF